MGMGGNGQGAAARSPITGRTKEQIAEDRLKAEAKEATRSEYRKTGVRVTPEMIAARQLVNQLSGQMTEADIPRLIAASALASGGERAVAPALQQLAPILAAGGAKDAENALTEKYILAQAAGQAGANPAIARALESRLGIPSATSSFASGANWPEIEKQYQDYLTKNPRETRENALKYLKTMNPHLDPVELDRHFSPPAPLPAVTQPRWAQENTPRPKSGIGYVRGTRSPRSGIGYVLGRKE